MSNATVAVLIIGYDGYSDLWDDCIGLLHRFWINCPYQIIFVNNNLDVSYKNVTVLHAGKDAEWSKKVQLGLECCNSDYVCLLLEDFLFGSEVNNQDVVELLSLMQENRIDYVKLVDMNSVLKPRNRHIKGNRKIQKIRYCDDYGISLQPAIWKRSFLQEKVGDGNYNAWLFEFDRVKEAQPKNRKYLPNAWYDTRNILNIQHGVIQGKYLPKTVKYFKKRGVFLNIQREVLSGRQYRKLRLIYFLKAIIPIRLRPAVKRLMEKKGMKFVSTTRGKE